MKNNQEAYKTLAIRCISHYAVTPNFMIITLGKESWEVFLHGDAAARIKIVQPYLKRHFPALKEIAWIPLDSLSDQDKAELREYLTAEDLCF